MRIKKFTTSSNQPYVEIQGFRPTLPESDYKGIKKYAKNNCMTVEDYLRYVFRTGLISAFEGEHTFDDPEDEDED